MLRSEQSSDPLARAAGGDKSPFEYTRCDLSAHPPTHPRIISTETSLVIQTSFIGDTVLTTPLISALAERGPVDVVTTPAGASVLAGHAHVRTVIAYDKRGNDSGISGFRRLAGVLRANRYSTAYLAQSSMRTALLAWAAGIPERIGLADSPGRRLFTGWVPNANDRHQAERLWRLAFPSGTLPAEMPRPTLFPGERERAAVNELLGAADDRPLVTLAPGSAWATKRWPFFEPLAVALAGHARIAVIGGADDVTAGEVVRVKVPDVVIAAGKLSLLASAELIGRSAALVTNDSSPTHLGTAMNTPTVSIYGPTIPGFGFGPLALHSRVVQHPSMPCRPCHHHGPRHCPLGHWMCMSDLGVAAVLDPVLEILSVRR